MKKHKTETLLKVARILPPLLTVGLMALCWRYFRNVTFAEIVHYVPENLWLAALTIWAIYAVKSMSIIFPLTALYIASGVIFPLWAALLVNLIGLCISASIPYWLGRFTGTELAQGVSHRYPKLGKAVALGGNNQIFLSYLLRAVGVIPGDLASVFLGATGVGYRSYLLGSMLGFFPAMMVQTLMGKYLDDPLAPSFVILFVILILISLLTGWFYNKRTKS